MKKLLPSLGWVLLGLLVVAGMLLSAGRNETAADPRANSFAPSGTAALFSLLSSRGYKVKIDRSPHPKLETGDVAIAFQVDSLIPVNESKIQEVRTGLENSSVQGATVIWLPIDRDFQAASVTAQTPQSYPRRDQLPRRVSSASTPEPADPSSEAILGDASRPFVSAVRSGVGYQVTYDDGIGLTNRFIDRADNAQVFMETLRAFAPRGAQVVFTEAAFGNIEEPGLLATIGSWAEAGWYQLLLLFLVIIYSLNRRFGLPEQYRPKQKGARELLDAVTDTFIRARAGASALQAASNEADGRLRSVLKLPRDAGAGELYRLLPESLINALTRVRAASEMQKVPSGEAFDLINKLESEMDEFLQVRKPQMVRRRRPKAA